MYYYLTQFKSYGNKLHDKLYRSNTVFMSLFQVVSLTDTI